MKLSGHTDTLTEASNLIDGLYSSDKMQTISNIELLPINFVQSNGAS